MKQKFSDEELAILETLGFRKFMDNAVICDFKDNARLVIWTDINDDYSIYYQVVYYPPNVKSLAKDLKKSEKFDSFNELQDFIKDA